MLPVRVREELNKLGLDVQGNPSVVQAGFSGARVYHLGSYAIKCHDLASLHELARIHLAQNLWARTLPLWVPGLIAWPSPTGHPSTTLLVDQDTVWECMEWKKGVALESIDQVKTEHLRSVGFALGHLHRISQNWDCNTDLAYAGAQDTDGRMMNRHRMLQSLVQMDFHPQYKTLDKLAHSKSEHAPYGDLLWMLEKALKSAHRIAKQSIDPMRRLYKTTTLKHWMHGDAWRGNWLFEGSVVSGLVDFRQASVRWPGFDFARAIGSMLWNEPEGWQTAWESYCEAIRKPGYTLDDALLMHRVSTVLTLAGYIDRFESQAIQDERLKSRLREVCSQLIDEQYFLLSQ